MNKKTAFILIVSLLIAAGGVLWWQNKPKVKAYEFAGQVKAVSDSTLNVRGGYQVAGHPEFLDLKNAKEVLVTIGSDTKLIKTITYLPASGKAGESFNYNKLRSQSTAGSVDDLKSIPGISIVIKSNKDIYGKSTFLASEIKYHMDQTETK